MVWTHPNRKNTVVGFERNRENERNIQRERERERERESKKKREIDRKREIERMNEGYKDTEEKLSKYAFRCN